MYSLDHDKELGDQMDQDVLFVEWMRKTSFPCQRSPWSEVSYRKGVKRVNIYINFSVFVTKRQWNCDIFSCEICETGTCIECSKMVYYKMDYVNW